MLRILLFFLILIFTTQLSWGQVKQPSLGILKLNAPELEEHKAIKINKYIESAFYKSRRFNIVSRQLNESIQQEREQQKENIDNIVIEQGRAIGADYIVKGFAKLSKKQLYKSSPKSRAPVQRRPTYNSRTRTSPRASSTTTTNQKTEKTSTTKKAKPSVTKKTTSKTSPRTSPRSSSNSKTSTTKSTASTSPRDRTKTTTKKAEPKTSPKREATTTAKKETSVAPPLSSEIDRVYTSTYISFTIKIINVKTGVIALEETYKGSVNGVTNFINKVVQKTFPYQFKIIEIMETKGDKKAKHILLDGGTKHGLARGTYLKAFEVSEENVGGKILKREIEVGQLYVKRVDTGGNFSLCTIYRGRKEILKKIKQGATLYCK